MFGLRLRGIFLTLVIAATLFAATEYLPAYISVYEFNDFIHQAVKYAAASRKTPEDVRQDIVKKAEELGIEVRRKDIRIVRRGLSFTLDLEYQRFINLRVLQHHLTFHPSETGEIFEHAHD